MTNLSTRPPSMSTPTRHPETGEPIAAGQRYQWTRTTRPSISRASVVRDYARRGAIALVAHTAVETVEVVKVARFGKLVRARVGGEPPEWYGPRDYLSWKPVPGVRYAAQDDD